MNVARIYDLLLLMYTVKNKVVFVVFVVADVAVVDIHCILSFEWILLTFFHNIIAI